MPFIVLTVCFLFIDCNTVSTIMGFFVCVSVCAWVIFKSWSCWCSVVCFLSLQFHATILVYFYLFIIILFLFQNNCIVLQLGYFFQSLLLLSLWPVFYLYLCKELLRFSHCKSQRVCHHTVIFFLEGYCKSTGNSNWRIQRSATGYNVSLTQTDNKQSRSKQWGQWEGDGSIC
jgi:hypothetical protein